YRVAGSVYCAVGYGLANMTMIEGGDGVIIIDPLESTANAALVMAEFRRITDKPVRALIYTHNHYDHVMGAEAVVSPAQVAAGEVAVIAHAGLMQGLLHQLSVVGEAVGIRSLYTFGAFLDKGPLGSVNEGIGPTLVQGPTGFIAPTRTFEDRLAETIAGVRLELIHMPSETDDEIVVWLPELRVLQSAEVIQGETYPNLYTLRGTTYRDPVQWYKSIDRLRQLEAQYLVPSHGRPLSGEEPVAALLTAYRDAIQFTHDQTVRLINRGYTPDEIAAALPALPKHLAAHPWLKEIYGTVRHSARNIYHGYLGWFQGDPTALAPLPPRERAERHVAQMGGRDAVVAAAQRAFDEGDAQWCAELLTYVIRVNPEDQPGRDLKAAALRQLGLRQSNINWRNFYLTAALELERNLDYERYDTGRGLAILSRLPLVSLLENIVTRVDAAKILEVRRTLALRVTDTGQDYGLEIRHGVVQLHQRMPPAPDITLSGSEEVLRGILLRQRSLPKELVLGTIELEGGVIAIAAFFDNFDPPAEIPAALAAR
ncbi:MAG TPA: alkyl sulfatase dimerization domain-containing protein, partial [Terriglobales bacterium]|nr:alkyl sulfatase dimerization domain-containing protein [Terriglobales bacterium]